MMIAEDATVDALAAEADVIPLDPDILSPVSGGNRTVYLRRTNLIKCEEWIPPRNYSGEI